MSTLIALAQEIETDYQGDSAYIGSVKVCRPNMDAAIGEGNLPYVQELNGVPDQTASGIVYGNFLVKAQTTQSGDVAILTVGYTKNVGNESSYELTVEGRNVMNGYKSSFRPFMDENDNLLTHVFNHFSTVRGLKSPVKIDITIGTPVIGHVRGFVLAGTGLNGNSTSRQKTFFFEATYGAGGWGGAGNIRSYEE